MSNEEELETNMRRHRCGTMELHYRRLEKVPGYREARQKIENALARRKKSEVRSPVCAEIPVVVHVLYETAAQNVSVEQIESQIAVLNADFRKKNVDLNKVPEPFESLIADARINFRLATLDPDGSPSDGITRTQTTRSGFDPYGEDMFFDARGGKDGWPSEQYLNIWVCNLSGGILGFASFPGGPRTTDGVVVSTNAFGTEGTATAPFDGGRTAVHEVGHWLNLRHIWGDDGNGCFGSDFVDDTPNAAGPNYGEPLFPVVSCDNGPHGDLFMNFMDYVDDAAMVMFTEGQVDRMHDILESSRLSLGERKPCPAEFFEIAEPLQELQQIFAGKRFWKEWSKDPIKDLIKDRPKEWVKDSPKESSKEAFKDPPKEAPKELPKEASYDPGPYGPMLMPPPYLNPQMSGSGRPGALPFVMATDKASQQSSTTLEQTREALKVLKQHGGLTARGVRLLAELQLKLDEGHK